MARKAEQPKKFEISDFFTKNKAEIGTTIDLLLPDGTPTGERLTIVGNESDTFRRAKSAAERAALELARIEDLQERDDAIYDQTVIICARCVIGWTLSTPCTFENVYELLSNAPYIKRLVDVAIGNRALFFARS